VAYEFCSPPDDFKSMQVNHKDLNKTNNNYLNLEWVTQSQNMKHFMKNGDTTKFMKCAIKKCKAGIRAKKPVIGVNENGEIIRFESIKSAVENKFNNINVLRLCVCLPLAQDFNLPTNLMGQIAQNRC